MTSIYHIVEKAEWAKAQQMGSYSHPSLEAEGFIHCSDRAELLETANKYYQGQENLILLEIDPSKLVSELKYERSESRNADFPHIFGPLNPEAVIQTYPLKLNASGGFELPGELV